MGERKELSPDERGRRQQAFVSAGIRLINSWRRTREDWTEAEELTLRIVGDIAANFTHPPGPAWTQAAKKALAKLRQVSTDRRRVQVLMALRNYVRTGVVPQGWEIGDDFSKLTERRLRKVRKGGELSIERDSRLYEILKSLKTERAVASTAAKLSLEVGVFGDARAKAESQAAAIKRIAKTYREAERRVLDEKHT